MKAFETHVTGIKRTAVPGHSQQMKEFDEVYDLTALDQQLQKADIVIADVPCSGYGVIGKKPEIKYISVIMFSFELLAPRPAQPGKQWF